MISIKFGTDGWRAIIAQEYTVDNVMRVAEGTARWLKKNNGTSVVIGYDCRFGGQLFTETTVRVLGKHGITCYVAPGFISTPMVSLGVVKMGADLGVVITASHNPPSYNGYKLKSRLGGPSVQSEVTAVENMIPDEVPTDLPEWEDLQEKGLIIEKDFEQIYFDHVQENFDMDAIHGANIRIAYDAMYGAGQTIMRRLFPHAVHLHSDFNPGFQGQAPEPIDRNLQELEELIKKDDTIDIGVANDGDADRIGLYDSDGHFVDSHHILLLLLLYLYEYKKQTGKVVITFSVTDKMKTLAERYGLDIEVTKIGFKYIAEIMANEDVLVGGEESGGLAVKGHLPERDGVWIALMILEFMAKSGKSLKELIDEVYARVGPFHSDRNDLHVEEEVKQAIIKTARDNPYTAFGDYKVTDVETTDGYKFNLGNGRWVMMRPSGTEPVLRVYAQAETEEETTKILKATRDTLGVKL